MDQFEPMMAQLINIQTKSQSVERQNFPVKILIILVTVLIKDFAQLL